MLAEDKERELYESYMAQCLWVTASAMASLVGQELGIPQYIEVTHPETKKKETLNSVKEHLLMRLRGG